MVKKRIAITLIGVLSIFIIPICFFGIHRLLLQKDGFVGGERVQIDGVNYHYVNITLSEEGKTIALVDDWKVNEIPEDSSHTFLVVRSFLDDYSIVREDYNIPESGNVSCAYIGNTMERTTDKDLLHTLTEILQTDYTDGKEILLSNKKEERGNFEHICVGYEDCPVGTDNSIYYIGQIDSVWVVIFRNELGEWDDGKLPAVYYELDSKYYEIFEDSGYWE